MRIMLRVLLASGISLLPALSLAAEVWRVAQEVNDHDFTLLVEPRIGQESTRDVGDSLVRSSFSRTRTTKSWEVTLKSDASGKFGFLAGYRAVSAPSGAKGPLLYHSAEHNPMFCVTPRGEASTSPPSMAGCFVDTDKDGKFDAIAFPGHTVDKDLPQPVPYTLAEQVKSEEIVDSRNYQVEVLYQGVSKGEAKISYREFKGGIARPAFTQDVSYELEADGSGVIAFRGLRIQIIKATRESITYVVQKLGSAPT